MQSPNSHPVRQRATLTKLTKLGTLGIITFFLTLGITAFLKEVVGMYYLYSYIVALIITTIINFVLNVKAVFYVKPNNARIIKYLATLATFFIINPLILGVLTDALHLHYLISTMLVTIGSFLLKFFIYDRWVFAASIQR